MVIDGRILTEGIRIIVFVEDIRGAVKDKFAILNMASEISTYEFYRLGYMPK